METDDGLRFAKTITTHNIASLPLTGESLYGGALLSTTKVYRRAHQLQPHLINTSQAGGLLKPWPLTPVLIK